MRLMLDQWTEPKLGANSDAQRETRETQHGPGKNKPDHRGS